MSNNDRYILSGPEDEYEIPKESLGKVIYDILQRRSPDEVININAKTKDVLTCGELLEKSIVYSNFYTKLGIQTGDTICIISENTIDYFIPVVGAFYVGITVNLINPNYSFGELERYMSISIPKLIFSSETSLNTISSVNDKLQLDIPVLLMPTRSNNNLSGKNYEKLFLESSTDLDNFRPIDFDYTNQVALLLLSSGTTGLPKGVMLTHQSLRMAIGLMSHPKYGDVISGDINLIVAPFYHVYGSLIQLIGIITSTTCMIMEKFIPELWLESIQEHRVTKMYTVPSLVTFLVQSPLVKNYNLSTVRHIIVGGSPLSKELESQICQRLPSAKIIHVYGLTEVAGPCTLQNKNKFVSVGCLAPGMLAKIINPDTRELLGPKEVGEICFKGPMLLKGYIPEQKYLDEHGFFKTGDAGYYDEDGFFFVVDRYKELIKYKGFQVPPAEIEAILITHSAVKECCVIGAPDERAGEVAAAFVILKEDLRCTEQELIDYVAERISFQKRLYGGVRFVEDLPRTPVGKIERRTLKHML